MRVVPVLLSLLVVSAGATGTCSYSKHNGVCQWVYQQQYKNISVANDPDQAEACCSACESDPICQQWLVYTKQVGKYKAGLCVLNKAVVMGHAPNQTACVSGEAPPITFPPTPAPAPAPKGALNVLFFAVDDLRPEINAFGVDGGSPIPGTHVPKMHTPNIDALASKSLVLTKNYVQQAVCSPTRASLLTGRRPDRTRTYDLYSYFRTVGGNFTTIPEHFLQSGYQSIGMGKIFHPGHASGNDDECCSWTKSTPYFHAPNLGYWSGSTGGGNEGKAWMSVNPQVEAGKPLPDNQTAVHAVQTIEKLAEEYHTNGGVAGVVSGATKPFFLAVGFHKPHLPFVASDQFFEFYPPSVVQLPPDDQPPKGMPRVAWSNYGELRNYAGQPTNATGQPGTDLPDSDVLALRRAYYASVTQTDDMLGKVMSALDASPFSKNTVISFWGDHGWQLGEHGEWCKHTNFEFAARAPMMIHVPGLTDSGITTSFYTEHVDLFPTLTEAAGLPPLTTCPPGDGSFKVALCTEGSSLVPLMKAPTKPVKTASFSQYPRGYQKPKISMSGTGEMHAWEDMNMTLDNMNFMGALDKANNDGQSAGKPSTSACIETVGKPGCTMGYTMVTMIGGHEYRYTEWADFNTKGFEKKVNWARNVGKELYNHSADAGENINLAVTQASDPGVVSLAAQLSKALHAGPDAARIQ